MSKIPMFPNKFAILASILGANPNIKILTGYVSQSSTISLNLTSTQAGFIWMPVQNGIYQIKYYYHFEESIDNGNIVLKRSNDGGDVTITTVAEQWTSYMAFIFDVAHPV